MGKEEIDNFQNMVGVVVFDLQLQLGPRIARYASPRSTQVSLALRTSAGRSIRFTMVRFYSNLLSVLRRVDRVDLVRLVDKHK